MYGRMASSNEADRRVDRARASRTISDLVRLETAAVASSLANSGLESFTVIVGILWHGITFCSNCNTTIHLLPKLAFDGDRRRAFFVPSFQYLFFKIFRFSPPKVHSNQIIECACEAAPTYECCRQKASTRE